MSRVTLLRLALVTVLSTALSLDTPSDGLWTLKDGEGKAFHTCRHDHFHATGALPVARAVDLYQGRERGVQTIGNIRITVDTSYLLNDPERQCTTTGEWIKFGEPAARTASNVCPAICDSCSCWYQCTTDDVLTVGKRARLTEFFIPKAIGFLQDALNVDRVSNLILNAGSCDSTSLKGVDIPTQYTTTGAPDTDLLILLTSRPTTLMDGTLAFAGACRRDSATGRPLAGFFNWGSNNITFTSDEEKESIGVAIHEMYHVLGFSSASFSLYKNTFMGSTSYPDGVTATKTRTDGSLSEDVTIIQTPKVISKARAHFGCSTLDGPELEDAGGTGTSGSHWEKRLFQDEFMSGSSSYEPKYSEISLALLEDSGWYTANYDVLDQFAAPFTWGKGEGCDFVEKRCDKWEGFYNCPYSTPTSTGCFPDLRKKAVCNGVRYSANLPAWNQYTSDPRVGGADSFADYCLFYFYFSSLDGDCTNTAYLVESDRELYGESNGPSSRCAASSLLPNGRHWEDPNFVSRGACYTMACQDQTTAYTLKVKVGATFYDCKKAGSTIEATGFSGYVVCPDPDEMCGPNSVHNLQTFTSWPEVFSVTPDSVDPGDTITITGTDFVTGVTVQLGLDHECGNVFVIDTTKLTCVVGEDTGLSEQLGNAESGKVDVVVTYPDGRSATKTSGITISAALLLLATWWLTSTVVTSLILSFL